MSVNAVPEGFHSVTVYLGVQDASEAIEFYKEVFGAVVEFRLDTPDGKVGHAELRIGDTRVMLSEPCDQSPLSSPQIAECPDTPCRPSVGLHLYVDNADETFALALEEGAVQISPVKDHFYGDRSGTLRDPYGHLWFISTHVEDVSPEDIEVRARRIFNEHPAG